jgi:hypothetical protein
MIYSKAKPRILNMSGFLSMTNKQLSASVLDKREAFPTPGESISDVVESAVYDEPKVRRAQFPAQQVFVLWSIPNTSQV